MLKLYNDDFIAKWDGFLHDVTLAPLTDLATANENLKDLASANSALKRLLTAVVAETDLARPPDAAAAGRRAAGGISKYLGKLGKLGKLATTGAKFVPTDRRPGARHQRPGRRPTTSSRSRAPSPRSTARRRRSTPRWRR